MVLFVRCAWFDKREPQANITESGFPTKKLAQDAEAKRRLDEQQKHELARAGAVMVSSELPKTLANLLAEFLQQHAQENCAPKTRERYAECVRYLSERAFGDAATRDYATALEPRMETFARFRRPHAKREIAADEPEDGQEYRRRCFSCLWAGGEMGLGFR